MSCKNQSECKRNKEKSLHLDSLSNKLIIDSYLPIYTKKWPVSKEQCYIATIWITTVYLLFFGINVAYQIHAWRFKVLVLFYLVNKQSSCSKCLNFCFQRVYSNFQLFSRIKVIFMTATCKVYHQNIFWLSILQANLAVEASKV